MPKSPPGSNNRSRLNAAPDTDQIEDGIEPYEDEVNIMFFLVEHSYPPRCIVTAQRNKTLV